MMSGRCSSASEPWKAMALFEKGLQVPGTPVECRKSRPCCQLAGRGYQGQILMSRRDADEGHGRRPLGRGRLGRRLFHVLERAALALALAGEEDVVPLDHLVERRGLEPQEAGGFLLDAARGLERGLDQAALE